MVGLLCLSQTTLNSPNQTIIYLHFFDRPDSCMTARISFFLKSLYPTAVFMFSENLRILSYPHYWLQNHTSTLAQIMFCSNIFLEVFYYFNNFIYHELGATYLRLSWKGSFCLSSKPFLWRINCDKWNSFVFNQYLNRSHCVTYSAYIKTKLLWYSWIAGYIKW